MTVVRLNGACFLSEVISILKLAMGASLVVLVVTNPSANAGDIKDAGSIPASRRFPAGGLWQPTPVFWPGESHGQRNLAGYSPWSLKESDTTEVT